MKPKEYIIDGKKVEAVKFVYYTTDGKRHENLIDNKDHDKVLEFIDWLETDKTVVKWY